MNQQTIEKILLKAKEGISTYLQTALQSGKIDQQLYATASKNTYTTLQQWLHDPHIDRISPHLKEGICTTIEQQQWVSLVNAFRQSIKFGTGGIRGMMAFDRQSIIKLYNEGIDAAILKGPNTFNNIVLLLTSVGVAQFGKQNNMNKIVIGYDSRVRGADFARVIAELFLAYGYTVYFFDAPCPYPEITFAIPNSVIKADIGILISASHNDYRYNGYKLSCSNGSQFDPTERDVMYKKFIASAKTEDIRLCSFNDAPKENLYFLGGNTPVERFNYAGKLENLIDMHQLYRNQIRSFALYEGISSVQLKEETALKIGYCAFHGAGTTMVPRLLSDVGFKHICEISHNDLNKCNGLFPSFRSMDGLEQQPDPGDPRAAKIAVDAFKEDHPGKFSTIDLLLGTDPDADRCGVIVKVPSDQQFIYNDQDWTLLPADDLWALLIHYRLTREKERFGSIKDVEKKFVTLSHTTSDVITKICQKHGIGVLKTWVGFASLSAATREIWKGNYQEYTKLVHGRDPQKPELCDPNVYESYGMDTGKRAINIGSMEQSNGFSILGGAPVDLRSMGVEGHVRDKDGIFAAFLASEIAAWAKSHGTTLFDLVDEQIFMDDEIGLFVTGYEPDPMDGEYPGIEGDKLKIAILRRTLGYYQLARAQDLSIADMKVKDVLIFRTGKYDSIYPPSYDFIFPDEGVRFFFDDEKLNHVTVRPSGTGNSLRLHTQLHTKIVGRTKEERKADLIKKKYELRFTSNKILAEIRAMLKAPKGKLFL